jgi:Domain of unknown function (DUF4214)
MPALFSSEVFALSGLEQGVPYMTDFSSFTSINAPGSASNYSYIAVTGVDAAGQAVGDYGDINGVLLSGFIATNGIATSFSALGASYTAIIGVTAAGEIYGNYVDSAGKQHGFLDNNGTITTVDAPSASSTSIYGVNAAGTIFGNYVDSLKNENGFIDNNGLITTIDVPGAASSSVTGVNASGAIAGMFTDGAGVAHGFIDNNGVFTTVDPAGAAKTYVVGVSDAGAVAGSYLDSAKNEHGFIDQNGVVTTINIPGSNNVGVSAENAAGEVVGYYLDSAGNAHGFVDISGVVSTVDVPGAMATDIIGVNASGEIFGFYIDHAGGEHGFAAQIASSGNGTVIQAMTDDGANEVGIGHVITITLDTSTAETVTGTPTLQLSDNEVAAYVGGSGTNALRFSYVVQPGDNTSDLQVTGLNLPNGATIHDASGNVFSTNVTADLGLQISGAVPFTSNADLTEALYIGYFGRAGDPVGDAYWLNQLNSGIISVSGAAASFSVQAESTALYPFLANPVGASQAQIVSFIDSVYQDLFNRAPDSGGLNYWQNYLSTNAGNPQAVGAFILAVVNGAQNTSLGPDQTTIADKVAIADYLTQSFTTAGINFSSPTSAAYAEAHSAILTVTSNPSAVTTAEASINAWITANPAGAAATPLIGVAASDLHAATGSLLVG